MNSHATDRPGAFEIDAPLVGAFFRSPATHWSAGVLAVVGLCCLGWWELAGRARWEAKQAEMARLDAVLAEQDRRIAYTEEYHRTHNGAWTPEEKQQLLETWEGWMREKRDFRANIPEFAREHGLVLPPDLLAYIRQHNDGVR